MQNSSKISGQPARQNARQGAFETLRSIDAELSTLAHTAALLAWDQETGMPELAIEGRAQQSALLSKLMHERASSPQLAQALDKLGPWHEQPDHFARSLVRKVARDYNRIRKFPADLAVASVKAASLAQHAWIAARSADSFEDFAPHLEELLALKREEAAALCDGGDSLQHSDRAPTSGSTSRHEGATNARTGCGIEYHHPKSSFQEPYDALLDVYEPGMTASQIELVFAVMRPRLQALLEKISSRPQIDDGFLRQHVPIAGQLAFANELLHDLGFDFARGRLDTSAHPFSERMGFDDVRITTRWEPDYFPSGIFSVIHEAGHALYEQGVDPEFRGSSLAAGTSLGVHESQSRLWENTIGRSEAFWQAYQPQVERLLGGTAHSAKAMYRALNRVQPGFIRVEADELTYNLHIMLRFSLERQLINGQLRVADLPQAWAQLSQELLGLTPARAAQGVLQDIHWAAGLFGYFPTYALGNIFGAQFMARQEADMGPLDAVIRRRDFASVLAWQREHIHRWGASKTSTELLQDVCGGGLDAEPFLSYLEDKYAEIYGFSK